MKKYIPIPITAIMDNDLTNAEKTLLFKMIANFGTAIINPSEPTMKILGVSRRTFYRLIDNLMKRQYIQRLGYIPGYKISVSMLAQNSVINGTDCVKNGTDECQKWHSKIEKESTKEEDKNNKQEYIYNNILKETENVNEKSKTILTTPENNEKEKAKHSAGACAREEPETEDKPKPKRAVFVKPTREEVLAYCRERQSTVSSSAFYDFYESKGWMVGKNHMKDWKAAVRTWEQKDKQSGKFYVPSENRTDGSDDLPY